MNIRNFFFSRQAAPITQEAAPNEPLIIREDFTLEENVDELTVSKILNILRRDTIEFTEREGLQWAVTNFVIRGIPVRVKLTENQDVWYYVDGDLHFDQRQAVEAIKALSIQF